MIYRRAEERLRVERLIGAGGADTLVQDVLAGLRAQPKWLPPKHFYDDEGGALFERICTLPEYYPTRTEHALLEEHAAEVMRRLEPRHLVELGSGSSTKTHVLLGALGALGRPAVYHPIDINEGLLRDTARALVERYPWLAVHARVADFDRPIEGLPSGPNVLAVFLGGTIGNFETEPGQRLLSRLAASLGEGAMLLLGTDMVKDPARLAAAYNDSQGVTAAFNLNVLRVLNRRLGGDIDLSGFEHLAFYDCRFERVEMHLKARRRQRIHLSRIDLAVDFREGETVRTEISRKFTDRSGRRMLESAGWRPVARFTPANGDYSLWLARASAEGPGASANPLAPAPG